MTCTTAEIFEQFLDDAECPVCETTRIDTHSGWRCPECSEFTEGGQ